MLRSIPIVTYHCGDRIGSGHPHSLHNGESSFVHALVIYLINREGVVGASFRWSLNPICPRHPLHHHHVSITAPSPPPPHHHQVIHHHHPWHPRRHCASTSLSSCLPPSPHSHTVVASSSSLPTHLTRRHRTTTIPRHLLLHAPSIHPPTPT